jgi:hypothetical protein
MKAAVAAGRDRWVWRRNRQSGDRPVRERVLTRPRPAWRGAAFAQALGRATRIGLRGFGSPALD